MTIEEQTHYLEIRIRDLEKEIGELKQQIPQSNILSQKFLSRAFAILGHNFVAGILISIPFYILMILLFSFFAGSVSYPGYGY